MVGSKSCAQYNITTRWVGFFLAIGLTLTRVVCAGGTTYYVNVNSGSDNHNGKSPTAAWRTISKANAVAQPGDTVLIYGGTYREAINPGRSGTDQMRISYRAAPSQTVIIEGVQYLLDLRGKSYITIEGITFRNPIWGWGEIRNGHHNELIGNTFIGNGRGPETAYAGLFIKDGSSRNRIINNVFLNWGEAKTLWGDAVRLSWGADNNLIEGNRFVNAGHALLGIDTSYNVVRNNYFENAWEKGIDLVWRVRPSWAPGQEFVARRNVIEGNTFVRNMIAANRENGGTGIQIGAAETIFRRNVVVESEKNGVCINGWMPDAPNAYGNRIYHNTFVNNGTAVGGSKNTGVFITQWGYINVNISNNVVKNNVFYGNDLQGDGAQIRIDLWPTSYYNAQFFQSYMIAGNCINTTPTMDISSLAGVQSLKYYQGRYPNLVRANRDDEPWFVNLDAGDYHLASGSSAIDAGVPLTTTRVGGTGTVVPVVDASYFTDGFGLVSGDPVKIGSNPAVRVLKVDYANNTLTLVQSINWVTGDPVHLGNFDGRGPDAGAYEFSDSQPPPPPASITVLAPHGGAVLRIGKTYTIQWTSSNLNGEVKILLSHDSGRRFEIIAHAASNTGSFTWKVQGPPTTQALIRVMSVNDSNIKDDSDQVFTIKR
jgi:hypothetical protein